MKLLTKVHIPDQADKYPAQLSGFSSGWRSPGPWRCGRR
jgi:ABC-type histidine transport system ATPase subunit